MRVISTDNFGNYVAYDQEPSWMLAENYNFCDEFVESKFAQKKNKILSVLMTAIHAIF